ncbi:unnamed protein product [Oppiella nova]|uniref:Peptidase C1A papain C-terminal domain-containing protein n=1 Tax=Oppiella nova TaxID=334625 RepID=A0A7R9M0I5_9ACAR|nr:unnamed protein product [Oppiella nova]CAG2168664.1 unnamed protein product [Oppiella nova]
MDYDPGKILPQDMIVKNADNHLYRVGLTLFKPDYIFHRKWIYNPNLVFMISFQQLVRDLTLLILNPNTSVAYHLYYGELEYFMGTGVGIHDREVALKLTNICHKSLTIGSIGSKIVFVVTATLWLTSCVSHVTWVQFILYAIPNALTLNLFGMIGKKCVVYLAQGSQIDYINSLRTTWKAGKNFKKGYEPSLGLVPSYRPLPPSSDITYDISNEDVPESFDSRVQWPNCYTVKEIRDQGCCGGCWAFAVAEVISDRICIASNGTQQVEVSAEDIIACGDAGSCNGGSPSRALHYYIESGVVTGGLLGSHEGCQPYTITHDNPCPTDPTPKCEQSCIAGYNRSYTEDKHFGSEAYGVGVKDVQKELMTYGPVSAQFYVYDDLFAYKTGVYWHVTGEFIAPHAVKLIGWGVENGVAYWLVANSWGTTWGEQGYFKIRRGNSECDFEHGFDAVLPKL